MLDIFPLSHTLSQNCSCMNFRCYMHTVSPFLVAGPVSSLSVTNTTLLITWDPPLTPSGDILVYEVHYQAVGGQEGGGVVNVTATSIELTGLRPESTYTISVRAYTAAGPGEERRLTVAAATTNTSQLLDRKSCAYHVIGIGLQPMSHKLESEISVH